MVIKDHRDNTELKVTQVTRDQLDHQDQLDLKDQTDHEEQLDLVEPRETLDQQYVQ